RFAGRRSPAFPTGLPWPRPRTGNRHAPPACPAHSAAVGAQRLQRPGLHLVTSTRRRHHTGSRSDRPQLPQRCRLHGQERRQLLRRLPGLRQYHQPHRSGRGSGALPGTGHGGRVWLHRNPGLQLPPGPVPGYSGPGRSTAPPAHDQPGNRTLMLYAQVHLTLPAWIHEAIDSQRAYPGDEAKVALAIELSRLNVEAETGGPFGAAGFGPDDRIISAAVNRVVPHSTSLAHAGHLADRPAPRRLQAPRLHAVLPPVALAGPSQPRCECYGATVWAGIDRLLIGANSADVDELTPFDEGRLPADWVG